MKKNLIIAILLVALTAAGVLYMTRNAFGENTDVKFKESMSLKQIAKANGTKVKKILHLLSHDNLKIWDLEGDDAKLSIPISKLNTAHPEYNLKPERVKESLLHLNEDKSPMVEIVKLSLWAVWLGLILIIVLKRKDVDKLRWVILLAAVLIFGVGLGASPNPMESIVKVVKLFEGIEADAETIIITFVLFTLMSLIGRKFICAWGCHLGASQELLHKIPIMKKIKKRLHVPFWLTLVVRVLFFIVFVLIAFGLVFGIKDVITHHVNYFKVFTWSDIAVIAMYTLPVLILASLFIYRPYCQFVCPFGLWAWLFENFAFNKIRIDEEKCIHCEKCVKVCPSDAMKVIYAGKRKCFVPDCWSCGACVTVCPTDAVSFAGNLKSTKTIKN